MKFTLEICSTSIESSRIAQNHGAQRLELCDNLFEGGTTPSAGMIRMVREAVELDLFVLIRPRGSDFNYTSAEFDVIKADIRNAKELGADGIVSGVLTPDGHIDVARTNKLVELAHPLPFTFHRAIDCTVDYEEAVKSAIESGASRILTSGHKSAAYEGIDNLQRIQNLYGSKITIMPGGGIKSTNILPIAQQTGCSEFHMTAKEWLNSEMQHKSDVPMNGSKDIPEYARMAASGKEIDLVCETLNGI